MKKAGSVGGMGPESTIIYYHDVVYGVQQALGRQEYPELTIESANVFNILRLCGEKKYDELTEYLLSAVRALAAAGAEFAVLSANTPHVVFDRLAQVSPLPMISIVEAACDEAARRGLKKIGLLGTVYTMTEDFFKAPFTRRGIEVISPLPQEAEMINGRIASELEVGIVRQETLAEFQTVISRMRDEDGIEAVVLGCTELPLLLGDEVSPVPCLDTLRIHVDAIVRAILSE